MNWQEICAHPQLKDPPFKLETDRWGHIAMSPATNRHSRLQSQIVRLLDRGAQEVWICSDDGAMSFYNNHSVLERSDRVPAFPLRVELPFG